MLELPRLLLVMAARTHHLLARHLVDWDWNRVATLSVSTFICYMYVDICSYWYLLNKNTNLNFMHTDTVGFLIVHTETESHLNYLSKIPKSLHLVRFHSYSRPQYWIWNVGKKVNHILRIYELEFASIWKRPIPMLSRTPRATTAAATLSTWRSSSGPATTAMEGRPSGSIGEQRT